MTTALMEFAVLNITLKYGIVHTDASVTLLASWTHITHYSMLSPSIIYKSHCFCATCFQPVNPELGVWIWCFFVHHISAFPHYYVQNRLRVNPITPVTSHVSPPLPSLP